MARLTARISFLCLSLTMAMSMFASPQNAVNRPKAFPLWNFDEADRSCRAKGRLQDKEYCESKLMDRIVADGKDAIPILISQLTDSRRVDRPIFDYWGQMTVGDIAYFVLNDLFTDSDWKTFNMPGLETPRTNCQSGSEACWHEFVQKHGRSYIRNQWLVAWKRNKDRIYWDTRARCFRTYNRQNS